MSQNNRKRVVCANKCGNVTRSTSGVCRSCLLRPVTVAEDLPQWQQGKWTPEAVAKAKQRRADELARREGQHKPLSLDSQAEIFTAVDTSPERTYSVTEASLPVQTTSAPSEFASVDSGALSKGDGWEARDVWSERLTVGIIVAVVMWLSIYRLRAKGVM